jgi:hypothetical protein
MAESLIHVWLPGNNFRLICNEAQGGGRGSLFGKAQEAQREKELRQRT